MAESEKLKRFFSLVHRILRLTVSKALLWSSTVKNVIQFLSSLDQMSSTTSVMALIQILFFIKPRVLLTMHGNVIHKGLYLCRRYIFKNIFDKKGSRGLGLRSVWLFGIGTVLAYFHAEEKVHVVIAVFKIWVIWLRSKGNHNLINFGLMPSRPSTFDFTLSKHSRTS